VQVNPELCKKALEKIGDPNLLVNLVSRRARQLRAGVGPLGRPFIPDATNLSLEDIALKEIIDGRITYEYIDEKETEKKGRKRSKF